VRQAPLDPRAQLEVVRRQIDETRGKPLISRYTTLRAIRTCLRLGGWFVFETRRSEVRDWETWNLAPCQTAERPSCHVP
jgi:hypothetical protein